MISVSDEILQDIKHLGIDAEYHHSTPNEWEEEHKKDFIKFKSREDLNLYRISGKFKENWWLEFVL